MDIGFKARKFFVEGSRKLQVLNDRFIKALARNQQRNTRWIRREQDSGHTAFKLVD